MAKDTPTPWKVSPAFEEAITNIDGRVICVTRAFAVGPQKAVANARHIVKCVNNYARLKDALRKMIDAEECSRDAPGILFDAAQEADALLAELDKGDE